MNIFATSQDPVQSAQVLDLKRVVKMILESFQLMSNAMWAHGGVGFYKYSHQNHPCSTWTVESRANFRWLLNHAIELGRVYESHYGRIHKCLEHAAKCEEYANTGTFGKEEATPFANCTEYKAIQDVHKAYRFQMLKKWELDKQAPRWSSFTDPVTLVQEWRRELATAPF